MAQCRMCGNYTEAPDGLCENCRSQQAAYANAQAQQQYAQPQQPYVQPQQPYAQPQQQQYAQQQQQAPAFADNVVISDDYGKVMDGFKRGLLSAIFGTIALMISYIALAIATVIGEGAGDISLILSILMSLPFVIVGLITGIKSVTFFIRRCKEHKAKPIPGFVCGVIGILSILYCYISALSIGL